MIRFSRFVASLSIALAAPAALADCPAGRWVTLAPMPEARQQLAAAEGDARIDAVGGLVGRANRSDVYVPRQTVVLSPRRRRD